MLKKLYCTVAFFLFATVLFVRLDHLFHPKGSHFSLDHIRSSNLFSPAFRLPEPSAEEQEEINRLFSQKFLFYNKGMHSCSFISEDGHYVLHFLKHQHAKSRSWLSLLPFSYNPYYQKFCKSRSLALHTMQAWHNAFVHLKEEMGLLYLHFDNTKRLHTKIIALDQDLEPYWVDLDKTVFYVQRHADLFYLRLADLIKQQEWEEAKLLITSVFDLVVHLFTKGALDRAQLTFFEPSLIDDRAVQVEIGPLYPRHRFPVDAWCHREGDCEQVIPRITKNLGAWLESHSPELVPHFQKCLELYKV